MVGTIKTVSAVLALLLSAPLAAATEGASLTPAEEAQLERNLERGLLLYRYDQSAWHVTDAAMAAIPNLPTSGATAYITTPAPNGLKTTFFGEGPEGYFAVYSAVWTGSAIESAIVHPVDARPPVTSEERRLIDAWKVAVDQAGGLAMCSSATPNIITIPGADTNQTVSVYFLTPQTDKDSYPVGGHHRIDVRDGKVVAKRAFTKSCVDLVLKPADGERPIALAVSHLLDPVPTEVHVFTMLAARLPLTVGVANGRTFSLYTAEGQPRAQIDDPKPQ